ncbi:MAG: tripartite tricarboxylate transporter TctB family protein [Deltaproteobacteria bacterium]|nr:tripartite tricarboxylate transporter TctB family protein [Deltaproteobacteria bacterium]
MLCVIEGIPPGHPCFGSFHMPGDEKDSSTGSRSRFHDLFSTVLGAFAAALLLTLRIQIDTTAVPYPFYKGPKIFPLMILSLMVASSIPPLLRLIRPAPDSEWYLDGRGWPRRPAGTVVLLIVFFLAGISYIGLEASVLLFLVSAYYLLGYRDLKINLLIPITYTLVIVAIFKYLLHIWFPEPLIFSLFGG